MLVYESTINLGVKQADGKLHEYNVIKHGDTHKLCEIFSHSPVHGIDGTCTFNHLHMIPHKQTAIISRA